VATHTDEPGVEVIRTDPEQPPVAVQGRSPMKAPAKVSYAIIALLGALGWTMIAIIRGESVNAVWFVVAAVCTYIIAASMRG